MTTCNADPRRDPCPHLRLDLGLEEYECALGVPLACRYTRDARPAAGTCEHRTPDEPEEER